MSQPAGREPLEIAVPVDGKPHRVSMGLRPLDLSAWLTPDEHRDAELREKARLLQERHGEVFAALPGSELAGAEVLELVLEQLTSMQPPLVAATADGWRDPATGLLVLTAGLHPLDVAARLVQEDLCVMERDVDGAWILTAAAVCFPSRWLLADKIGRSLSAIHDPVPGYSRIERATDLTFDRMSLERPVARSNWTLIDDPALFQPRPESRGKASTALNEATDSVDLLARIYLRVEQQTLRLLPTSGGVLFTIRTRVDPLADLTPGQRARLLDTLVTVDPDTVTYKGWSALLPSVVERLNESR
jgi:hypothetical protein